MALKTFNLDEESYKKYSSHCKSKGVSMSKQIDTFIRQEIAKLAEMSVKDVSVPATVKSEVQKHHNSMMKYC